VEQATTVLWANCTGFKLTNVPYTCTPQNVFRCDLKLNTLMNSDDTTVVL